MNISNLVCKNLVFFDMFCKFYGWGLVFFWIICCIDLNVYRILIKVFWYWIVDLFLVIIVYYRYRKVKNVGRMIKIVLGI